MYIMGIAILLLFILQISYLNESFKFFTILPQYIISRSISDRCTFNSLGCHIKGFKKIWTLEDLQWLKHVNENRLISSKLISV